MYDAINLAFLEFALACQRAIKQGWELGDLDYGERRFGIGPSIQARHGNVVVEIRCPEDMEKLLET